MSNRPITTEERANWSAIAQIEILQAFCDTMFWQAPDYAFQGGTSLHMNWASPRYSEDLDFLVSEKVAGSLGRDMTQVIDRFRQQMALVEPDFDIRFVDKSHDRMLTFNVALARPNVLGRVMVKLEFWKVSPQYLEKYETEIRTPSIPRIQGYNLRVDCQLPAATLKSIFVDKMVAVGSRPYLKMRDFFDIWWLRKNQDFVQPSDQEIVSLFKHHATAYQSEMTPVETLQSFLQKTADIDAMVQKCETDLQTFLPVHVWNALYPKDVRNMICDVRAQAGLLANLLSQNETEQDADNSSNRVATNRAKP